MRYAAVVLAAGASRRFAAGSKLQQHIAGRPVLEWVLASVGAARLTHILLVTAEEDRQTRELAVRYGAEVVVNPIASRGMGTSLARGISSLPAGIDAAFICLGDMPFVSPLTYSTLADAFARAGRGDRAIVVPIHHGTRGHPVLFGAGHFTALRELQDDHGARHVVAANQEDLVLCDTADRGVIIDIDTQQDLAACADLIAALPLR